MVGDDVAAEAVTDIILEVFDEEAVNRLCDDHIKNTYLKSMEFRNGATMDIQPARELVAAWVGAARALLEGAENYSETRVDFGIPEDPQRYAFVVQKAGKLTPHEARRKAEADLERLQQAIRSPVTWLAGLASGMCKVTGADGDDWTHWADCIFKAANELCLLLPENQEGDDAR